MAFVPFAALLLTHPTGRFDSPLERAFPVVVGVTLVAFASAIVMFDSTPLPGCENCPENALLVSDRPTLADALQSGAAAAAIVLSLLGAGLLIRRWRRATPVLRRALLPVFLSGGAALLGLVVDEVLEELVSTGASDAVTPFVFAAFAAVPVTFLVRDPPNAHGALLRLGAALWRSIGASRFATRSLPRWATRASTSCTGSTGGRVPAGWTTRVAPFPIPRPPRRGPSGSWSGAASRSRRCSTTWRSTRRASASTR